MNTVDSISNKIYKYYDVRVATFDTWSTQIEPNSYHLAKAGFYYSGSGDKVTCFSCHIELSKWDKTDNPWEEHLKHSPNCEFLKIVGYTEGEDVTVKSPGFQRYTFGEQSPWLNNSLFK